MDEMNIFETAPSFPVIPLRGLVMFPDMVLHFDVGRKKSVAALKAAMNADQKIFLVSQKDAAVDEPGLDDLFGVGVICSVRQMMRIPGSENMRVVAEGMRDELSDHRHQRGSLSKLCGDCEKLLWLQGVGHRFS